MWGWESSGHGVRTTLLGIAASLAAVDAVQAQVVRGVVSDSAGAGVGGAIVSLLNPTGAVDATTHTARDGTYHLRATHAGEYAIFVRRLGYAVLRTEWRTVAVGDTLVANLSLRPVAAELSSVTIRAQRDSIRKSRLFGMDMRTIGATILPPAAIDLAVPNARDVAEMVGRLAPAGYSVDYERHCVIQERGWPRECLPVVLDGLLVSEPMALRDLLRDLPPHVVDYVVILRGHEVGVLYGTIGVNGVILIVTKQGLRRGPSP